MAMLENKIKQKLNEQLVPSHLQLINESHLHMGHMGDDGSGDTHFRLKISSKKFNNKSRIACHSLINDVLAKEFKEGLHALAIEIIKN